MPIEIQRYEGKTLSKYQTFNVAENYVQIKCAEDAIEAFKFAKEKHLKPFVLGAGSNVFFKHTKIKSLIIKNCLPAEIKYLDDDRFEISSSVAMIDMLKYLYEESRDSCYYLASAPCQIGGAIAMNAGTGPREAHFIGDFLESVKYIQNSKVIEKPSTQLELGYRKSIFKDIDNAFILSAVFKFPKKTFTNNPILERLEWAKTNQDLSAPNCGSLCTRYDGKLMKFVRGVFKNSPAYMSVKKLNWLLNKSENPRYLRRFIWLLSFLHEILLKEIKYEIKIVE